MNFPVPREKTNNSIQGMVVPASKDPSMLYSKEMEVISPSCGRKKSYLGPTPGERQQSDRRKSTVKESLGAFLPKGSEHEFSDKTEETVSYHERPRPRNWQPQHAVTGSNGPEIPKRSMSGGSIMAAMQTAGQAFAPQLPRRSVSQGKPSSLIKSKASGRLDDPFIDALLGGSASTPSTKAMSFASTPSSRGAGSRKLWQGIGLDQFKEKMGYRKAAPLDDRSGHRNSGRSRSFDAAEHAAEESTSTESTSKETSDVGRRYKQRRSKSPSYLGERVMGDSASKSERVNRSIDKAMGHLSVSSHHTRSSTDTWKCNPVSTSEHGMHSIDFSRRLPRRSISEGVHPSWDLLRQHSSEHGPRTCLPPPPDTPPLAYTTTRPTLRRGKKPGAQADSFYGLELERELNDGRPVYGNRSPSSSHRRSNRSRSRESPHRNKSSSKKGQNVGVVRTPSTSRRKSYKSRPQHSPNSATLTPSSVSSSQRRTVSIGSVGGWADLELNALEGDETASFAVAEHQPRPFNGEASYGEDIDMAWEVGENLMNLGVQLLTRGHDIRLAASRRNSLVESAHGSPSPRTGGNRRSVTYDGDGELHDDTLRSQRSGVPSQVLCTHDLDMHDRDEEEEDIESLAGIVDQDRGQSKSSHSNRYTSSSSGSDLGASGNDISLNSLNSMNSLMMMGSGDISGTNLPDDDEMEAIMNGIYDDVAPLRPQSHDSVSFRDNNESLNNSNNFNVSNRFEDSFRGLEFDFSDLDLGTPSAASSSGVNKAKRTRHKVGRSKSEGEGMKGVNVGARGGKPPTRRRSVKNKVNPTPKEPR